jgi:hypothetical protein
VRATTKITRTAGEMNWRCEGDDEDSKYQLKVKDGNTELTMLDRYYILPRGTRKGNKLIKQDTGKKFVVSDGSIDLSRWKGTVIRCTVSLFRENQRSTRYIHRHGEKYTKTSYHESLRY